jgi:hypothetical protein
MPVYEPELVQLIDEAVRRLQEEMEQAAPSMARRVSEWMTGLAGGRAEDYFRHPQGFPMLLLPWWLEKTIHRVPDPAFQADLVYSTINGYYHIRLIDNLMDGHATMEREILPSLGFFHDQFQGTYYRYFGHGHPFWDFFRGVWFAAAEAAVEDAALESIDLQQFEETAAVKTCAAKIPLAAVCLRYERKDLIEAWSSFTDRFSRWHQMWNDVFTWRRDIKHGTATYFLSEGGRRKAATQSIAEWVMKGGFHWGLQLLHEWLSEMKDTATGLGSSELLLYLDRREALLAEQSSTMASALSAARQLLSALDEV